MSTRLNLLAIIANSLQEINTVEVSVVEETAIKVAIETGITSIVLGDAYTKANILKKIKVKLSNSFREKEKIKLETLLLLSLLGIKLGLSYFEKKPNFLYAYDSNKVVKVLVNRLVSRGIDLMDLPNFVLTKI